MEAREVRPQRMYGATIPIERLGTYRLGFIVPVTTTRRRLESCLHSWSLQPATPTDRPQRQPQPQRPRVSDIYALLNPESGACTDSVETRQAIASQEEPGELEVGISEPYMRGEAAEVRQAITSQEQEQPRAPEVGISAPNMRAEDVNVQQAAASRDRVFNAQEQLGAAVGIPGSSVRGKNAEVEQATTSPHTHAGGNRAQQPSSTSSGGTEAQKTWRVDSGLHTPESNGKGRVSMSLKSIAEVPEVDERGEEVEEKAGDDVEQVREEVVKEEEEEAEEAEVENEPVEVTAVPIVRGHMIVRIGTNSDLPAKKAFELICRAQSSAITNIRLYFVIKEAYTAVERSLQTCTLIEVKDRVLEADIESAIW
ncbi:hypothetical protein DE146DRAFT_734775 [Phaeosphaeria sp. MPI-PUGE-AT-0046c]|nr:hypothetical protein DE146DRAFT_734775 [Phaeosphaeria sp. MPI-PUGE-AT-0046c]